MHVISIASDFTVTPGARFRTHGKFSGEEFRMDLLTPVFKDEVRFPRIRIILDGVSEYAPSFLEEAFGGLAREFSAEAVLKRVEFVSENDESLVPEILGYIEQVRQSTT